MADTILADLGLNPAGVPALRAPARRVLIHYLMRWGHYDAARRCLQQLLVTHSRQVTVYDDLARAHLALGEGARALEIMRRRQALAVSNSSRILEARAHLAAGDPVAAQEIARELTEQQPDLVSGWGLLADLHLAAGDLDAAEAAIRQQEALLPDAAPTAMQMARLWQARGGADRALLWARTALARSERDGRPPNVDLLRLLEELYRTTRQTAQAAATAARLDQSRGRDLEALHQALHPSAVPEKEPVPEKAPRPSPPLPPSGPAPEPVSMASEILAGAVDLSPEERARLEAALRRSFPHDGFRPGQPDVIGAVLRGESVLAVMPTGAGKSLCYQLAAQELPGTTLVISPLIALMKDQLDGLPQGIAGQATTLNSSLDGAELGDRLERAAAGGYKMLYAAPERLRQRPFLHALNRAGISLMVVDEAHCVSLWGHDFRPDYHFIAKAWRELEQPPILGMTATATPRVRDDIRNALGQMRLIASAVHRPNLRLEARQFANNGQKRQALLALCRETAGSGIVYATARKTCEELALLLRRAGVDAIHYHAGIEDRAAAQDRFMSGQARVVVATIAFGMGVDKADVRFIVHYNPPKTLENYYQEAGRAGRDGLPSRCVLFYSTSDKAVLSRWINEDALQAQFLRGLYSTLEGRLKAVGTGLVAVADLERDLGVDETRVRVGVHFLEMAGLLRRDFDLPRTASLVLAQGAAGQDPELDRFVEAARLRPGQRVSRDLLALSHELGADPGQIEARLLAWQDAGWLGYRGTGRDMLLTLPPPPAGSRQRVAAMLAEYRAGQEGRLAEMMAYAQTRRCRHGAISTYFGGKPIDRCGACDNCLDGAAAATAPAGRPVRPAYPATPAPHGELYGPAADLVLRGVEQLPHPMGRSGLVKALQGAGSSKVQADRFPLFGLMSNWTQRAIGDLVVQMEEEGLLAPFEKSGFRLLRLTDRGRARLEAVQPGPPAPVPPLAPPTKTSKAAGAQGVSPPAEVPEDYDRELFERLRAWRLETAREIGKPPYVVLHDSTLRAIAARRPETLGELAAVKGIGPAKLERYGQGILDLMKGQV